MFPKIYFVGTQDKIFNVGNCLMWIAEAIVFGIIAALAGIYLIGGSAIGNAGYNGDLWMSSVIIFTIVIIVLTIKLAMHIRHWTKMMLFAITICSLAPYLIYIWISNYTLSKHVKGTIIMSFRTPQTYFIVIFFSVLDVLIVSVIIYISFSLNRAMKKITLKMVNELDEKSDEKSLIKSLLESSSESPDINDKGASDRTEELLKTVQVRPRI
jgi:uncharacterized membrane protein